MAYKIYLDDTNLVDRSNLPRKSIGDEVTENIYAISQVFTMKGYVVYIHPENRYYTVVFDCNGGGKFRESFIVR